MNSCYGQISGLRQFPQNSLLPNQCLYNLSSCMSTHRIAAAARLVFYWLCVRIAGVSQWARSGCVGHHGHSWAVQLAHPAPVPLLRLPLTLGLLGNILQPLPWPNAPVQLHKTVGMSLEEHNITQYLESTRINISVCELSPACAA